MKLEEKANKIGQIWIIMLHARKKKKEEKKASGEVCDVIAKVDEHNDCNSDK